MIPDILQERRLAWRADVTNTRALHAHAAAAAAAAACCLQQGCHACATAPPRNYPTMFKRIGVKILKDGLYALWA